MAQAGAVTADLVMAEQAIATAQPAENMLEFAVREHSRLVYRIAYSVLRDPADAEDAVQEVFLRVLRYGNKAARIEDLKAWLARIAWRVAVERRDKLTNSALRHEQATDNLYSPASGADRILLEKERTGALQQMIAGLPGNCATPWFSQPSRNCRRARSPPCSVSAKPPSDREHFAPGKFFASAWLQWEIANEYRRQIPRTRNRSLAGRCAFPILESRAAGRTRRTRSARLAEGRQESSRKLPWWRVLAFTAAAIVAIAFFWHAHTGLTQLRQNPVAKVSAPATRMEPGTNGEPSLDESAIQTLRARKPLSVVPKEVHRVGRANAIQQAALPKLEQFPSRRNLSQQESLLARHLTEQSNKEALLETAATRAEVDLSIDSLEISSLQVTDIQISGQ